MSLLKEIQRSLLVEKSDLGTILLKLKFLAAKLGSNVLEDWVSHESEGYPDDVDVPDYRKIGASYTGSFAGPHGREMKNVRIPTAIIQKFAGSQWTLIEYRQGIASIEALLASHERRAGGLEIDASDLILVLQGKVYAGYNCYHVSGQVSTSALADIQHVVRSRALDLTLKIENLIEGALEISVSDAPSIDKNNSDQVENLSHQIIYGNYTNITNSGDCAIITVNNTENDQGALTEVLIAQGISAEDAASFSEIVSQEDHSGDMEDPFGEKAKDWLLDNLKKAADGTWKVGISAATTVLTEAALRYYGLK